MPSSTSAARLPAHASVLRKGRVSEAGRAYLLTTVTEGRRPLFADFHVGRLLAAELRNEHAARRVVSLAWVIMPDHLHWLLTLEQGALGQLMQRVKSRSAIAINARLGCTQRLWQKGFHDHAVRGEEDLASIARYVVANPLRAGLVSHIGDYPLWDADWL
ncbi:MAG: transposase [Sulfuricellaceae bacterium]|nr:transposase [Sulfuricellaceae bacterium]